jgi:tetratricopeptide (TPR) repeat protein
VTSSAANSAERLKAGLALRRRRKLKAAVAEFAALVEAEPGNALGWYYLAVTHDNRGAEASAIPCYLRAIELDPDLPMRFEASLYLASSYAKTGRPAEALRWLAAAERFGREHELIPKLRRRLTRAPGARRALPR